ncbi:MAG: ribonuclease Z [Eubacterium sp.]|nr:ribonuclease Z [Eubacterium sp.]
MLKFLGRNSAFNPEQNSAFFVSGDSLVLLDCPMSALQKMIKIGKKGFGSDEPLNRIYVIVTHTHGDHVGGIPMLIHYAYYVWKLPVTVAAPSKEVAEDLLFLIERLEGCERDAYTLVNLGNDGGDFAEPDENLKSWVKDVILTEHTPGLKGRCFGYHLDIAGTSVIYTGDTGTLEPFKPFLTEGAVLYTEASAYDSPVHISLKRELGYLEGITKKGVTVYLMHLDNEDEIKNIIEGSNIKIAPMKG